MPYLILGLGLLVGLILAARWFAAADPKTVAKALRWLLVGLVVLVGGFFLVTGRLAWALYTLPALLPWLMRLRAWHRMAKSFRRMAGGTGAGAGERSELRTRFLEVFLDHDSGEMTGRVCEGEFAGRALADLTLAELLRLLGVCGAEDEESARVLEAFLDREHPDWRNRAGAGDGGRKRGESAASGAMGRAEALQVLGLDEGASAAEIKAAHHRLIAGLHPDHGGSDYLAAKINEAKDVLLGRS